MEHQLFASLQGLQRRIEQGEKLWFLPEAVHQYTWAREQPSGAYVRQIADPQGLLSALTDFRDRRTDGDPQVRKRLQEEGYALMCIVEGNFTTTYHVEDRIVLLSEKDHYVTD